MGVTDSVKLIKSEMSDMDSAMLNISLRQKQAESQEINKALGTGTDADKFKVSPVILTVALSVILIVSHYRYEL